MRTWRSKPPANIRGVKEVLERAERNRIELPKIVQVRASDWDVVILADELEELEIRLKEEQGS